MLAYLFDSDFFSVDKRGEVGRVNWFCNLECMDLLT